MAAGAQAAASDGGAMGRARRAGAADMVRAAVVRGGRGHRLAAFAASTNDRSARTVPRRSTTNRRAASTGSTSGSSSVIMVATLGLRVFRLAEPYQMHFDEVYHARTATEFLQHWRYGISHDIYEWTHPHLAKYAMAGGLVAWGDDRVSATSDLGVPVRDAIVEVRRDDPALPDGRAGDRVHVVTGSELRSYDLETAGADLRHAGPGRRRADARPGRRAALHRDGRRPDPRLRRVLASTASGTSEAGAFVEPPSAFGRIDGSIAQHVRDRGRSDTPRRDGRRPAGRRSTRPRPRSVGIDRSGWHRRFRARWDRVGRDDAARRGRGSRGGGRGSRRPARRRRRDLRGQAPLHGRIGRSLPASAASTQKANIDAAIADGRLAGLSVEDVPRVADRDRRRRDVRRLPRPATSWRRRPRSTAAPSASPSSTVDDPKLYVTTGGPTAEAPGGVTIIAVGGDAAKNGPTVQRTMPMPAAGRRVSRGTRRPRWSTSSASSPDGDGWTIYVIEPHANAVFADARLPFEPSAWSALTSPRRIPADDRQQILAFEDERPGRERRDRQARVRLAPARASSPAPLMAGLLYLLARILFRRREIAVLVGIFALVDGMLFVQSRIGMNDAYVALGILAAYTLFAAIWTGCLALARRVLGRDAADRGLPWPGAGLEMGRPLRDRRHSGSCPHPERARPAGPDRPRLIGLTGVLGHLALVVPAGGGLGNLPFVVIMIGLTSIAAVVNVLHPIAWSDDETRFAVGAPAALGVIVALGAIGLGQAGTQFVQVGVGEQAGRMVVAVTPLHVAVGLVLVSLSASTPPSPWPAGRVSGRSRRRPSRPILRRSCRRHRRRRARRGCARARSSGLPLAWMARLPARHPARALRGLVHPVGDASTATGSPPAGRRATRARRSST